METPSTTQVRYTCPNTGSIVEIDLAPFVEYIGQDFSQEPARIADSLQEIIDDVTLHGLEHPSEVVRAQARTMVKLARSLRDIYRNARIYQLQSIA